MRLHPSPGGRPTTPTPTFVHSPQSIRPANRTGCGQGRRDGGARGRIVVACMCTPVHADTRAAVHTADNERERDRRAEESKIPGGRWGEGGSGAIVRGSSFRGIRGV